MGRRLVQERAMIKQELRTQNQTALRPREKGLLIQGCEFPAPLVSQEPFPLFFLSLVSFPLFFFFFFFIFIFIFLFFYFFFSERSLLLYILLLRLSSSYTCQSSMSILECTSHRPFFLALCELLWPPSHCSGVTST